MNIFQTITGRLLLIGIPAIIFMFIDKKFLFSNKIQKIFKIDTFFKLYTFIFLALLLSSIVVKFIAIAAKMTQGTLYISQIIVIGILIALFADIQKIFVKKDKISEKNN